LIKRTLKLVFSEAPGYAIALLAVALVSGTLPFGMAMVSRALIDESVKLASLKPGEGGPFLHSAAFGWILVEFLLALALVASDRLNDFLKHVLSLRTELKINLSIMERAMALPLGRFEDSAYHDKLLRAQSEAGFRPLQVLQDAISALRFLVQTVAFGMLLADYSIYTALAILVANLPVCILEIRLSVVAYGITQARSPILRKTMYISNVMVGGEYAKEGRLFRYGTYLLGKYRNLFKSFICADADISLKRTLWATILSALALVAYYFCISAVVRSVIAKEVSVGALVMYSAAMYQTQAGVRALMRHVNGLFESKLFLKNLYDFLEEPGTGSDGSFSEFSNDKVGRGQSAHQGIELKDVCFRYPTSASETIRKVSLRFGKGRRYAVVGLNGSGKSTLVKLMLGLYEPSSGEVLLNGVSLRALGPRGIAQRFGVTFQDFNLYQLSLRENVALGCLDLLNDDKAICEALDCAGFDEYKRYPAGLETQLGRMVEDGIGLSGGQWQKIALARALLNKRAEVLIFDEPTSALDPESEFRFIHRSIPRCDTQTVVFISHRLSTVKYADEIVVVEDGAIAEAGSHEQLLQRNGAYVRLFENQLDAK
jgi:ATP-binding cassette subfamily B protein